MGDHNFWIFKNGKNRLQEDFIKKFECVISKKKSERNLLNLRRNLKNGHYL